MPTHTSPADALRRVEALLAKAASTDFSSEAEALLAKAQELMTRHAIDQTTVGNATSEVRDAVIGKVIVVRSPYASARASLLNGIARANHCRLVLQGVVDGGRQCVLFGHGSDVAHVTVMYTTLSLYATRAVLAADSGNESPRRFRHAFLLAFAARVAERLHAASAAARADAELETGGSVALALIDRSRAVDHAVEKQYPWTRTVRRSASSYAGLRSGRSAADAAALGHQRALGQRPALGPG